MNKMRQFWMPVCVAVLLLGGMVSCNGNTSPADAFGNFEAEEVVVSARSNGTLVQWALSEGSFLEEGQEVGLVDTVLPHLEAAQLQSAIQGVAARRMQWQRGLELQEERLAVLQKEWERARSLYGEQAISEQVYDEVSGRYQIARREWHQFKAQGQVLEAEKALSQTRWLAAREQVERCRIVAPLSGVVLQSYAENGEFAAVGKPLFKMADTRELILRAYVSGSQLDDLQVGQEVQVRYDKAEDGEHEVRGTVMWIAASAEFTPKIIQTKEERVDLVYAVKIRVPNPEGRIKIGMPGEVVFLSSRK
ncbi:HlyD family secretion protein [Geofilum rhodophaeum]|uniref:HlyD family secretion protein n=1 Tax=Geofilum rhodophaeum TaxID=1965019 RepID=UPI001F0B1EC4|nr:HlyD family efflux transporter periplasmic adaptor subunit [Geofilum rhodophaeum]